jgi:hypothetical protein
MTAAMRKGDAMTVRCSKCGEELLGAVNRCWKCGQMFALRPEMDGRPPVRFAAAAAQEPISATVVGACVPEAAVALSGGPSAAGARVTPVPAPRVALPRRNSTAEMIEAHRLRMMAMGGTVASIVMGVFAALLATVWPPVAIVAVIGLLMGIWGLYSPRRNWALLGMLLCCLAIGIGTYGGVRRLNDMWMDRTAIMVEDQPLEPPETEY